MTQHGTYRFAAVVAATALMLANYGCEGCEAPVDFAPAFRLPDFFYFTPRPGITPQPSFTNGDDCRNADSSWRCTSTRGDTLAMAVYMGACYGRSGPFSLCGIAALERVDRTGGPSPTFEVRSSDALSPLHFELGPYRSTDILSFNPEEDRLQFHLSGEGLDNEPFSCERATGPGAVLDPDCDGVIDALSTPTPSLGSTQPRAPAPTSTPTPSATATPTGV